MQSESVEAALGKVLDLLKQYVVLDFLLDISGAHPSWQLGYDGLVYVNLQ